MEGDNLCPDFPREGLAFPSSHSLTHSKGSVVSEEGSEEEKERTLSPVKESLRLGTLGPRSFVNVPLANRSVGLVFSSMIFFLISLGDVESSLIISSLPASSLSTGFVTCNSLESSVSLFSWASFRWNVKREA